LKVTQAQQHATAVLLCCGGIDLCSGLGLSVNDTKSET